MRSNTFAGISPRLFIVQTNIYSQIKIIPNGINFEKRTIWDAASRPSAWSPFCFSKVKANSGILEHKKLVKNRKLISVDLSSLLLFHIFQTAYLMFLFPPTKVPLVQQMNSLHTFHNGKKSSYRVHWTLLAGFSGFAVALMIIIRCFSFCGFLSFPIFSLICSWPITTRLPPWASSLT